VSEREIDRQRQRETEREIGRGRVEERYKIYIIDGAYEMMVCDG